MAKTKSEIFETNEVEPVSETKKVKTKKVLSVERLEELKAQLARGRATKLAKKEGLKPKTETIAKVEPTNPKVAEVSKPMPTNTDELAELRNEIKTLKEQMTKPAPVHVPAPAPPRVVNKPVATPETVPIAVSIPKKEVAPPPPKKIIYSAFKVASW